MRSDRAIAWGMPSGWCLKVTRSGTLRPIGGDAFDAASWSVIFEAHDLRGANSALYKGSLLPRRPRLPGARRAKARRCTFRSPGRLITNVYIDGFNLYYGLLRGSPHKWLDLEKFCDQLLPKNSVRRIYYFTAKVDARPHDPDQPVRQLAYLRALAILPRVEVHFGTFLASVVRQPLVESDPVNPRRWRMAAKAPALKRDASGAVLTDWVLKTEEKGSDVNLANAPSSYPTTPIF